jgi:bifunctional DNase/RNase
MSKKRVKLNILGLSYSQTQTGAYALVLAEEGGERRIPIIIGSVEAQSIAIKLEGLAPPRPLTHDLFLNFATAFNVEIVEVVVYKLEEGIFYSELICKRESETLHIDSRTSDAVALALRFNCPIYTYDEIMDKAGIVLDFDKDEEESLEIEVKEQKTSKEYAGSSVEELKAMLDDAVKKEDYEKASRIRDEIKMREEKRK